jgi:hypothetical protein
MSNTSPCDASRDKNHCVHCYFAAYDRGELIEGVDFWEPSLTCESCQVRPGSHVSDFDTAAFWICDTCDD